MKRKIVIKIFDDANEILFINNEFVEISSTFLVYNLKCVWKEYKCKCDSCNLKIDIVEMGRIRENVTNLADALFFNY